MGVTLEISTSAPAYFAGDTVEGMVTMEAEPSKPEGSKALELKLTLVGCAKTIAWYTTSTGQSTMSHRAEESDDFLSEEISLESFDGRVEAGTHTFPFSFSLPEDLLPSMEESSGSDSCSLQYSLKARLDNGAFAFDPKSKLRLKVLGSRVETVPATPTVVGPTSKAVRRLLMTSGTMTIAFRVDRLEVRPCGAIELVIVLQNDSPVTVTDMIIKLKQLTKWKARSHKRSKKRTLASIVVPASELAGAEPRAKGSERGQSSASIAEAARENVQQRLAGGDGAQYTIYVPASALFTMEAEKKIDVSHWLSVSLKNWGMNSDPKLSIPVHIWPPETVADAEVLAGPTQEQSTEEDDP